MGCKVCARRPSFTARNCLGSCWERRGIFGESEWAIYLSSHQNGRYKRRLTYLKIDEELQKEAAWQEILSRFLTSFCSGQVSFSFLVSKARCIVRMCSASVRVPGTGGRSGSCLQLPGRSDDGAGVRGLSCFGRTHKQGANLRSISAWFAAAGPPF